MSSGVTVVFEEEVPVLVAFVLVPAVEAEAFEIGPQLKPLCTAVVSYLVAYANIELHFAIDQDFGYLVDNYCCPNNYCIASADCRPSFNSS